MQIAEIAIIISIFSALISGLSLGWNIYRDVILKAKVRVHFGICKVALQGITPSPTYISIAATNHGPGPVKLHMVNMKDTSLLKKIFRNEKFAVVLHDWQNPLSGQLPHKLEVGEDFRLLFPYDTDCMLKNGWSHIGISDSFDRVHWASSRNVKAAQDKWKKDFVGH
jgi:hypothetical protein